MIFPKPKNIQESFESFLPVIERKLPTMTEVFTNSKPIISLGLEYCITSTNDLVDSVNNLSMNLNNQNSILLMENKEQMMTTLNSPIHSKLFQNTLNIPKLIPFELFELKNMKSHLLKRYKRNDFLKTNGTIKSNKGRKKTNICHYDNMHDLIHNHVIPKWKKYLAYKCEKTSKNRKDKFRSDTIWKKIIRDVREFYRILFRMRFHYLDYKDAKGATRCIEIFFEELGIPIEQEYRGDTALFTFLHQTHKVTGVRLFKKPKDSSDSSPFEAIDNFNSLTKKIFMSDKLAARLFYFVFSNFIEQYAVYINQKYQERIASSICLVLKCFKKIKCLEELPRVHFLLN